MYYSTMIYQPFLIWKQVRFHIIGRILSSTHHKWPHPNMSIWQTLVWMSNPTWLRRISFQIPSWLWQINTNFKIPIPQYPLLWATTFPYRLPREITHQEISHHLHSTTKWTKMHRTHFQVLEASSIVWELDSKLTFSAPTQIFHPDLSIQIKKPYKFQ